MINGVDILTMVWHEVVKGLYILAGVGLLLLVAALFNHRRKSKENGCDAFKKFFSGAV